MAVVTLRSWAKNHAEDEEMIEEKNRWKKATASAMLAVAMGLTALSLLAQDNRKAISNPPPSYPEMAKKLRLSGAVKVLVVIAPDGRIKGVKVMGGHPVLVEAVQETLKTWKYAPASSETTILLEFDFHP